MLGTGRQVTKSSKVAKGCKRTSSSSANGSAVDGRSSGCCIYFRKYSRSDWYAALESSIWTGQEAVSRF